MSQEIITEEFTNGMSEKEKVNDARMVTEMVVAINTLTAERDRLKEQVRVISVGLYNIRAIIESCHWSSMSKVVIYDAIDSVLGPAITNAEKGLDLGGGHILRDMGYFGIIGHPSGALAAILAS